MRVYLSNSASIFEFLYLKSMVEDPKWIKEQTELPESDRSILFKESTEVELTNSLADAEVVIGSTESVYDRIVIFNLPPSSKDPLELLTKHNRVISRFELGVNHRKLDYTKEVYEPRFYPENIKFKDPLHEGEVLSKSSIKDWILNYDQSKDHWYAFKPRMYFNTTYEKDLTIVGLIKDLNYD